LSLDDEFPHTILPYSGTTERLPHPFKIPPYNIQVSTSKLLMAADEGGVARGGAIGGAGGGVAGSQVPLPQMFSKVAARYAPLVLPVPLHDIPENYKKNMPKFTGEGDLTTTEHINLFDQFENILGHEHDDVYSRLLVQNFEGHARTWFQGLAVGSIWSYDELKNVFIRQ